MKIKFSAFSILIILFLINKISAQSDFKPGYVITNSNDTLYGQIDYRVESTLNKTCTFILNTESVKKVFAPLDLKAYRFINSKYFVSKEIKNTNGLTIKVFLEYLIKGGLNVYYLNEEGYEHYFIEKKDSGIIELPYKEGIFTSNNADYEYQSTLHIEILKKYLDADPEFNEKINSIKKPGHDNLIKLAKEYNNKYCKNEECITYQDKLPHAKVNFEIVAGVVSYNKNSNLNQLSHFQGGALVHIGFPRINEKIYLKTGALFSYLEDKTGTPLSLGKIPFQIEYIYPTGIFRPRFSYGVNIYDISVFTIATSFVVGLNIALNKHLFLSMNSDLEFAPTSQMLPLIPNNMLSYSLNTGLYIVL